MKKATHDKELSLKIFEDSSLALEHCLYMARRFFSRDEKAQSKAEDMLDIDFLKGLIEGRNEHSQEIIDLVTTHSTTFRFEQMDPIDQAIFLEGGLEYLIHKTPRKVIINEMIEIAKRYGDEGSSKLVNGIGHKMINDLRGEL